MASKIHILAIPFPLQGHINPMVQFSKLLNSKGIKVTIITSPTTDNLIQTQTTSPLMTIQSVPEITDKIESSDPLEAYMKSLKLSISKGLPDIITNMADSDYPVKVVVYDTYMPWVLDLAHDFGLKGAAFSTQSCSVCSLFYHFHEGRSKLPLEECVISLPSLPILGHNDLPSFITDTASYPTIVKIILDQSLNYGKEDWLLFNTFDKLEHEVINWMANQWAIKTIGPTIPSKYFQKTSNEDKNYGLTMFKAADENACIKWLDSKESGSVVYVSFGSISDLKENQMVEISLGLVNSNLNFLWVVRDSEESKLPSNFMCEMKKDKGLIVNWCPQLEVLSHQAVGCFVTHCGWNSTLEALSLGVPMVAMPIWVDQPTNAKFIADVWRVGVRVKHGENGGIVTREEIERCMKEVMEGDKKMEYKENAAKWKKSANEAVNGGSSEKNLEELVMELCALY